MTDTPEPAYVEDTNGSYVSYFQTLTDGKTDAIERHLAEGDIVAHMNVASLHGELLATKAKLAEVEAERDAGLLREQHANERAMQHLRRAEKVEIASKNYAAFSREWQTRAEAAEADLTAAYRAGVEDAAAWITPLNPRDDWTQLACDRYQNATRIRALPTPAPAELMARIAEEKTDD